MLVLSQHNNQNLMLYYNQMTILILHGIFGHAGENWTKWLHDELVKKGHTVLMPNLPNPNRPERKAWLKFVKEITKEIKQENVIIVGHSLGVATALDFIEQVDGKVKALISVSGFSEDYGSELNSHFMSEKKIVFKKVKNHVKKIAVIYGDDDPYVPQKSLAALAKNLEITPKIVPEG